MAANFISSEQHQRARRTGGWLGRARSYAIQIRR